MGQPKINSSLRNGMPLPCGNGKERLIAALFAETIWWIFVLNAKHLRKANKIKSAMWHGVRVIMLFIFIASQDGWKNFKHALFVQLLGNSRSTESEFSETKINKKCQNVKEHQSYLVKIVYLTKFKYPSFFIFSIRILR